MQSDWTDLRHKRPKKGRTKPYAVERRYVGPDRPWHVRWAPSREWREVKRYEKLQGAEQALAKRNHNGWPGYEYRLATH